MFTSDSESLEKKMIMMKAQWFTADSKPPGMIITEGH
jgi:hypothetical protein